MLRRSHKVILVIIAAVLLTTVATRIIYVNVKYPDKIIVKVQEGTSHSLDNDEYKDIMMSVDKVDWLTEKETLAEYQGVVTGNKATGAQKVCRVNISLKNKGKKDMKIALVRIMIESDSYDWNSVDSECFHMDNDCDIYLKINAGEEKNVILPFVVSEVYLTSEEWSDPEKAGNYLVFSRYPVKTEWRF
ncbi:MAG: hypothetical protein VZR00_04985 [Lachnospiraceae bacterium]|jgi:hypothetical protein|nr:hypothetical protein [Lachnospiraceae bacterium]MEE3461231.1 hypothetical protein [Lachnospiraceae bacterium]